MRTPKLAPMRALLTRAGVNPEKGAAATNQKVQRQSSTKTKQKPQAIQASRSQKQENLGLQVTVQDLAAKTAFFDL